MRSRSRRHGSRRVPALVAVAVLLGIFASAGTAGAADIDLAFKGGAATTPEPSWVNPVGASVGGRVGVSFLGGFYLGASVMSSWFDVSSPGPAPPSSTSVLTLGGDVGYGFAVRDWLTLRPQLGLGMATSSRVSPRSSRLALGRSSSGPMPAFWCST